MKVKFHGELYIHKGSLSIVRCLTTGKHCAKLLYTAFFDIANARKSDEHFGKKHDRKAFKALKWAFPYTIPIFAGFWFLGIAYGIYANASGFSFVYPLIMSMTIYGGSLEFIAIGVTVAVNFWKRQMLLSIASGTICYMLLVQLVFK